MIHLLERMFNSMSWSEVAGLSSLAIIALLTWFGDADGSFDADGEGGDGGD